MSKHKWITKKYLSTKEVVVNQTYWVSKYEIYRYGMELTSRDMTKIELHKNNVGKNCENRT